MTVRVEVNKDILSWALSRSGLTKDTLMAEHPEKFSKINQWFDGSMQPTLNQLEDFANVTSTPFGFLFLQKPPEEKLDIPFYRTLKDDPPSNISVNLIDTIYDIKSKQNWLHDFLIEEGFDKLSFIRSINNDLSSVECAKRIKKYLDLDDNWSSRFKSWSDTLLFLRSKIENIGIFIVTNGIVGNNTHRKLNVNEFRGFVLIDDYSPFIFINGSDVKAAQMFTLAHELVHVFIGESAIFDLKYLSPSEKYTEQFCNSVAAEFLVPETILIQKWCGQNFTELSKSFKVSEIVIARRALDLKLINKNTFLEFYNNYISKEFYKKELSKKDDDQQGNYYNNQNFRVGKKFMRYILYALRENKLLYSEAYKLTGLYGNTFDQYSDIIEGDR